MFKFTVIMPITAKVETVLRLLGTYKIILKRKNHRNTMFQFYYIGDDFLVLRESGIKLKLLCTAWKIVHYDLFDRVMYQKRNTLIDCLGPMSLVFFMRNAKTQFFQKFKRREKL